MVEILRLHFFLVSLSVIKVVEVGNNDWNGQGDCQHTSNGTQGAYYLSPHANRPIGNAKDKKEWKIRERIKVQNITVQNATIPPR